MRGGGDLATGVIQKLYRSGFRVLVLETEMPLAIRRTVALCDAIYYDKAQVEDLTAVKINWTNNIIENLDNIYNCWMQNNIPVIIDPEAESVKILKPIALVDAILAKKNIGTNLDMAPITIGLGPGFCAKKDVNIVIETMRGHNLGRLIFNGSALKNTGIPGEIGGKSAQRVIHSPSTGIIKHMSSIGDILQEGQAIFEVNGYIAKAPFTGLLRGLIHENIFVQKGTKVADIDPRTDVDWNTISDKARCLGGAVLEAILYLKNNN